MTERPILFSGPMVRAILDGTKTQTRRVVSRANTLVDGSAFSKRLWPSLRFDKAWVDPGPSPAGNPGPYLKTPWVHPDDHSDDERVSRIYSKPWVGDRLWVKETFAPTAANRAAVYKADDGPWRDDYQTRGWKWKPSIFMPRKLSRTTLEITDVRVERVQSISEDDALAEGIVALTAGSMAPAAKLGAVAGLVQAMPKTTRRAFLGGSIAAALSLTADRFIPATEPTQRELFGTLWDSINAKRGFGWEANPWVWVYDFKRVPTLTDDA